MRSFALHQPETAADAVALARRFGPNSRFIAGGTDLVIQMNRHVAAPENVIDLSRIPDLDGIEEGPDGFAIGALATHKSIERHPGFAPGTPLAALGEAARVVGGHQVRNQGTIGGNIANASPAADLLPPLLTLEARLDLIGPDGTRTLALPDFLVGHRRTARSNDELVGRIRFAKPAGRTATAFLKAGRRKAMEISVVSVSARLSLEPETGICREDSIALGAVAGTAIRVPATEALLDGQAPGDDLLGEAGRAAAASCSPISDVRASAEYRHLLVEALVPRALRLCLERAGSVR